MSIVVFVEDWNGAYKKASYEAVGYAKNWASMIGAKVIAVTSSEAPATELADYGADHCIQISLG
ncbi:MAG: electron transfer flavoprotein subunit alpha/FixB family protein, partial [Schleiferiaceae bacterium]